MSLLQPPQHLELPEALARSFDGATDPDAVWGSEEARGYCRRLATTHYENFHVGTWLFPAEAREHAFNIYAYCRWSDDLADETGDPKTSLALLGWWRGLLEACFEGRAEHPVFVALRETIKAFELDITPFARLLDAFEQDQRVFRYDTFDQLVDYCRGSADPVGHLVLALLGYRDEKRRALSDKTCTGLQLANHWQDVENDLRRGRIYIPKEDMDRFEVNEEDLAMPEANRNVRELMQFEVERARQWFAEGAPLAGMVEGRARIDIELFTRGGLATLDAIESQHFDVLYRRPKIGKLKKARLFGGALLSGLFGRSKAEVAS